MSLKTPALKGQRYPHTKTSRRRSDTALELEVAIVVVTQKHKSRGVRVTASYENMAEHNQQAQTARSSRTPTDCPPYISLFRYVGRGNISK